MIATAGEAVGLPAVLDALAQQSLDESDYEVIVVDNNVDDEHRRWVASIAETSGARLARATTRGAGAARNVGMGVAEGDIVVFVDDDIEVAPDFLDAHLDAHTSAGPTVGVGRIVERNRRAGWFRRYLEERRVVNRLPVGGAVDFRNFYGANVSVTRHALVAAGGFDERFLRREDTELGYRLEQAGARFVYVPKATGEHHSDFGPLDHLRRARVTGFYLGMLIAEHPEVEMHERMGLYRPGMRWVGLIAGLPLVGVGLAVQKLTTRPLFFGMTGLTLFRAASGFRDYRRTIGNQRTAS